MQKIIPTIYFYLLSAVGMILIIIGLFSTIHYIVGISAYDKYPLGYNPESRCEFAPRAVLPEGEMEAPLNNTKVTQKEDCLKNVEGERKNKKVDDLERSITFTTIGLLVFGSHFYFARKQRSR